jgi:hypothetical protein
MRLCKPDSLAWHGKRGYSKVLARVLTAHFATLDGHSPTQRGLAARYDTLKRYALKPMCHHQRVPMYLSMGMICVAGGGEGTEEALSWLEAALEMAEKVEDLTALPQLYYLHGYAESQRLRYRSAAEDMAACAGVLEHLTHEYALLDHALEQEAIARLAGFEIMLGEYDVAAQLYDEAQVLAEAAPERPLEMADIHWGRALLLRWQRKPVPALEHARAASRLLVALDDRSGAGRMRSILAEIALDLAEASAAHSPNQRRDYYITLALSAAQEARQLTRDAQDTAGAGLAALAAARASALAGRNERRVGMIEDVIRQGKRTEDSALRGQALTALGREYALAGYDARARGCFREAYDVLARADLPGLGIWPLRALRDDPRWHTVDQ